LRREKNVPLARRWKFTEISGCGSRFSFLLFDSFMRSDEAETVNALGKSSHVASAGEGASADLLGVSSACPD
jgi:hypothetical protein